MEIIREHMRGMCKVVEDMTRRIEEGKGEYIGVAARDKRLKKKRLLLFFLTNILYS